MSRKGRRANTRPAIRGVVHVIGETTAMALLALPMAAEAQGAAPTGQFQGQPGQFQTQPTAAAPTAPTDATAPPANANPYGHPMQSGNLTAPPPFSTAQQGQAPDPNATSYDANLEESKRHDSGRGLTWFWLEADGGFEHVGLHSFDVEEQKLTAGFVDTEQSGGFVGGGIGARFFVFTVGARGRMGFFQAWQLGRVGGELGLHLPFGFVEPHFDLGGGYAALGHFDGVVAQQISIHGGYARADAGVDLYPVSQLSFGATASFDFMALTRPGVAPAELANLQSQNAITAAQSELLAADGSSYGATFAITGVIGLHL